MIADYLNDGITCPGCGKPLGQKKTTYFLNIIYEHLTGKKMHKRKDVCLQHAGVWYCAKCYSFSFSIYDFSYRCQYCHQKKTDCKSQRINHKIYCGTCLQDVVLPLLEKGVKPAQINPIPPDSQVSVPTTQPMNTVKSNDNATVTPAAKAPAPTVQPKIKDKPRDDIKTERTPNPLLHKVDTISSREEAVAAIRQAIKDRLSGDSFDLILADRMDDLEHYTGNRPECLFGRLNFMTHKIQTERSDYPDRQGVSNFSIGGHEISLQQFNQIDWKNYRIKGLRFFTCQQDWDEVFNDEITQAIEQRYRQKHAVRINQRRAIRKAQNEFESMQIRVCTDQDCNIVHLPKDGTHKPVKMAFVEIQVEKTGSVYEVTRTFAENHHGPEQIQKRVLSEVESGWLEDEVQYTMKSMDKALIDLAGHNLTHFQFYYNNLLPTMLVEGRCQIRISFAHRKKYEQKCLATPYCLHSLRTNIENLIQFGSWIEDT